MCVCVFVELRRFTSIHLYSCILVLMFLLCVWVCVVCATQAGKYCPNLGTEKTCPEGFYCREGSCEPTECQPLVVCPEGTQSETKGFAGLLFNFCLALVGYIAFQTYKYCRNKKREERAAHWCVVPRSSFQTLALCMARHCGECCSLPTPHSSLLTPHSSLLTPHSSLLTPHCHGARSHTGT